MKDFFTKNIVLKLLSVLLALLLWLTVMNVEDPTVSTTISDIPVQIVNDDVIKSRGYGYAIESGEKVDIRVRGRRSVVDNITAEDFTAIADFNSFSSMKMVPIEVECTDEHAAEIVWTAKTDSMAILLEAEATASMSIRKEWEGAVKDGYYLFDNSTDTSLVSVKGAESQVAAVKEIVAEINIDGLKDTTDIEVELYAVNMEGERIDSKKISLTPETITVHLTINPIKEIPLAIRTKGLPAQYYYMGEIDYAPKQMQVTGDADVLEGLSYLTVEVDVTDAEEDVTTQINLEEYVEENYSGLSIKVVDQNTAMGIRVPIIRLEEKTFEVKKEDVRLVNADTVKYNYTISSSIFSKVLVRGKAEDLANVEVSDFDLYINVDGLISGNNQSILMETGYQGGLFEIEPGKMNVTIEEIKNEFEVQAENIQ